MLSNKQKFHVTQASGGSGSAGVTPEVPMTAGALGHIGTCRNSRPALLQLIRRLGGLSFR